MARLLARGLSRVFPSSRHHYSPVLTSLFRAPLSTQSQQLENTPFLAQYLVTSFGFSPIRALRIATSKNFTAIKSREQPDLVVSFLKEIGFSDSHIIRLISTHPNLLYKNIDATLKPQTCALMDAGFTGQKFIQLLLSNPKCLYLKGTISHILFWKHFVGNSDETLLKVIKWSRLLTTCDIDKFVMPRINLLREYGLSDQQIVQLITHTRGFFFQSVDCFKLDLEQTEKLGFLRNSNMFFYGLLTVFCLKNETLKKKVAYFKEMYGCSEKEVCSAFRKNPGFLRLSEEVISSKMGFLIKKAGFESSSIASQSRLLSCSIQRILLPRHHVLSTLQAKGLKEIKSLWSVCVISEEQFLKRFVVPYEKYLPELAESYAAACAGKLPI